MPRSTAFAGPPAGETWAVVHARREADARRAGEVLESIVRWTDGPVETAPVAAGPDRHGAPPREAEH